MNWPEDGSLEQAQAQVREALQTGDMIDCPCCGQTVKMYSRQLHRSVVLGLWAIARSKGDGLLPHEILGTLARRGYHVSGNDHCKLTYWMLATKDITDGRWRCTETGFQFLAGSLFIPKYVYVFDGTVTGHSYEKISIKDIAKKFDLEALLDPDNLYK